MMTKTKFLLGFGAGYVLGSKAGRQRYEQIMRQTRSLMGKPAVQDATHLLKEQAGSVLSTAKKVVTDKVGHGSNGDSPGAAYADVSSSGRIDPYPA